MGISKNIKKEIQEFFLSRKQYKNNTVTTFNNLNKANSLAMFFCISSKAELDKIRKLSRIATKDYRELVIFVFADAYESFDVITNKAIHFFNLEDFTLFGKMKERLENLLEERHFDLLISFEQTGLHVCQSIIASIKAGIKIGTDKTDNNNLYHLTLACNEEEFDIVRFYEQVKHYISVLNIKTAS
jgi:ADP-heptose:LPS heptosyltransferase